MLKGKTQSRPPSQAIDLGAAISFAVPYLPIFFLITSVTPASGIYSRYFGLELTTIAGVMFLAGLFDTVTDPTIGYLSDRYLRRMGGRKPLIVAGAILLIPATWLLLVPITRADGTVGIGYFLFCYLLFYLSTTLITTPYYALSSEVASDSESRVRIFGVSKNIQLLGLLLGNSVPLLPLFLSTSVTPETWRVSAILGILVLIPVVVYFIRSVPEPDVSRQPETAMPISLRKSLSAMLANRPYMLYLIADIAFNICFGFNLGLSFIFIDSYLGMGEHYVRLYILLLIIGMLSISPAIRITNKIGKRAAWALSAGLFTLCPVIIGVVILSGNQGLFALVLLYVFKFIHGFVTSIKHVSMNAYLADMVDYDRLKTGDCRSGAYYSLRGFVEKIGLATLGPSIGLAIVGFYGFSPADPVMNADIQWGFFLTMGLITTIAGLATCVLILLNPIDERRSDIIKKRLQARDRRAARNAAQSETVDTTDPTGHVRQVAMTEPT